MKDMKNDNSNKVEFQPDIFFDIAEHSNYSGTGNYNQYELPPEPEPEPEPPQPDPFTMANCNFDDDTSPENIGSRSSYLLLADRMEGLDIQNDGGNIYSFSDFISSQKFSSGTITQKFTDVKMYEEHYWVHPIYLIINGFWGILMAPDINVLDAGNYPFKMQVGGDIVGSVTPNANADPQPRTYTLLLNQEFTLNKNGTNNNVTLALTDINIYTSLSYTSNDTTITTNYYIVKDADIETVINKGGSPWIFTSMTFTNDTNNITIPDNQNLEIGSDAVFAQPLVTNNGVWTYTYDGTNSVLDLLKSNLDAAYPYDSANKLSAGWGYLFSNYILVPIPPAQE